MDETLTKKPADPPELEWPGARLRRTLDPSGARVPEHAHDWPLLSLFVIGSYTNETEIGEEFIAGPSAVLYAAGAAHRNTIGVDGFEQVEIELDPDWLKGVRLPESPVVRWIGGGVGAHARELARLCAQDLTAERLLAALRDFFAAAIAEPATRRPTWLARVTRWLRDEPSPGVADIARELGLHPSWMGAAYRRAAGEGPAETVARRRVELAVRLLRETAAPLAHVAAEAGFCDQSHMIRTFRRVLGRLPSAVRQDRARLRGRPDGGTPA